MRDLLLEHLDDLPGAAAFCARMNQIDNTREQWRAVADWFDTILREGRDQQAFVAQPLLAA
ncbi:dihydrouridine synthase [Bordetella pertussis]|nr:dihydrouridine synthase [Bordetella pertussis]